MKTIDLRTRPNSPGLYARLTWQALFDYYREIGGDLKRMDSLLCDYDILKRRFTEEPSGFQLLLEIGKSGYTHFWAADVPVAGLLIAYQPKAMSITITRVNEDC